MKIFIDTLKLQIEPALNSQNIKNIVLRQGEVVFEERKKSLLDDFDNHPITKDLNTGPDGDGNKSRTLGGVKGNLYSFIGFPAGENPAKELKQVLNDGIKLTKSVTFNRKLFGYTIPVNTISFEDIYKKFPYPKSKQMGNKPWNPGSWVQGIETGISGLNVYITLFHKTSKSLRALIHKASRSGPAIQLKNPKLIKKFGRSSSFHPTSYLTGIFNRFQTKFRARGRFI